MEELEQEQKKNRVSRWLDEVDDKIAERGNWHKTFWQFVKYCIVSTIITIIQVVLVNGLYYLMKGWTEPLPSFLADIFSESTVGEGHSNWGYILPFFLSNFIANSVGYFLNRHRTFRSDAPIWHYVVYIGVLFSLILFSTWFQGVVANWFIEMGYELIAPTIGMSAAGIIQFIVLFPIQKFVLLREKKKISEIAETEHN